MLHNNVPCQNEENSPITLPQSSFTMVPWTWRDLIWAIFLGVFTVLTLVALMTLALTLYQIVLGIPKASQPLAFLTVLAELGLLLPVWLFGVYKYRLSWRDVGLRPFDPSRSLGLGCIFLLFAFAFNFTWSLFLSLFNLRPQPDMLPLFGKGIGGLFLAILAGGVVAPIAEEIFFRGYLFAGLYKLLGRRRAALLSAALFALAHILPTSWPPIFVLGLLFALLYEQTGSIWPSVIVHAAMNTLAFLFTYLSQWISI
ncbi:MAG: CPBP family intramembrane glutamic endopeptidase [Anaerolineae bacterium]